MTLWIPKPEPGGTVLAHLLNARNVDCVIAPVMRIAPPAATASLSEKDVEQMSALLLTSPHALEFCSYPDTLHSLPAYVVGKRARAMLETMGHRGEIIEHFQVNEALSSLRLADLRPHRHVLYVSGEYIANDPAPQLARYGMKVTRLITYAQHIETTISESMLDGLKTGKIDSLCLTSPRIAKACGYLLTHYGMNASALTAYCQSPSIAATAAQVGFTNVKVASAPTQEALVALITD